MSKGAAAISIIMALVLGFVVGNITGSKAPAEPGAAVSAEAAGGTAPGGAMADATRIPVGNSPVIGRNDALATLVIFSDFQCPFCSRVETTISQLRQQYGNDLRVVWKNNPLPFHDKAMPASEAAMEAHAQRGNEGFWRMHALLFQNQQSLDRADLERYAQQIGLDMTRFRAALDNHTHQAAIRRDMDLATAIGAQGTPNMYINGTNIVGAQPVERFRTLIDAVLTRARTITPRNQVYARMVAEPVAAPDAPQPQQPQQRPAEPDPAQVLRVPVGNSPVLGRPDALVTVVVFSDFQCPFCSRVETTLNALRTRYGNDIRFVWKNEPLPFHDKARPAAEASAEVFAQRGNEGFWRYHDLLFQNQQTIDRPDLERFAGQIPGINMARFRAALDNHTHQAAVEADHQLAQQVQANGTPHFFVNGRRIVGAQPEDAFVRLVDEVKRTAEEWIRSHPGTTRGNFYERYMAEADATVRMAGGGGNAPAAAPEQPDENRVYTVRANPRAPTLGPNNARVIIEHFSDFQCPFCSRVIPTMDQLVQRYGNRIQFRWRDYPLPFHNNAMPASEAGREVLAQRGSQAFWRYHHMLFENQQNLDRATLERLATELGGIDMTRFRAALDNHTHQAAIRDDMAAADATGAQIGTPAFFINGKFVAGALPVDQFVTRIDAALAAH
ncbi:MAG: DsbA family protein [Myxococcales bacterium]|nr:DsbA family protein [Myxococcales bacterium]